MIPAKGIISAEKPGIELEGLFFDCDLPEINAKRYALQRKTEKIDVRYDPRDTSQIYVLDSEQKLHVCPLNGRIPENNSFRSITWQYYRELRTKGKQMDKEAERYKLEQSISFKKDTKDVVREAKRRRPRGEGVNTKEIKHNRKKEKEWKSNENSFQKRFNLNEEVKTADEPAPLSSEEPKSIEIQESPKASAQKTWEPLLTMEERKDQVARDAMDDLWD